MHYILTEIVEHDFRAAKQWSLSRWGRELTKQYFIDLQNAAEYIAKNSHSIPSKDYLVGDSGLGICCKRALYGLSSYC